LKSVALEEQLELDRINTAITNIVDKIRATADSADEYGKNFANNTKDSFKSALSSALKGDKDEDKSIFETFVDKLLDDFTSNIIDTFSSKISDSLFDSGPLADILNKIGIGIPGGKAKKDSETKEQSGVIAGGTLDNLFDSFDFSNIFDSLKNTFSSLISSIASMFGGGSAASGGKTDWFGLVLQGASMFLANGGKIVGPGTGRSDSILAAVSNGEFVVNEASTKKNLKLLEMINANKVPHFADGGYISPSLSTPSLPTITGDNKKNKDVSQVINLEITGDISRQTKAEIYKMLPEIALGVNFFNKEKGYS
jgi:hypothetical protein